MLKLQPSLLFFEQSKIHPVNIKSDIIYNNWELCQNTSFIFVTTQILSNNKVEFIDNDFLWFVLLLHLRLEFIFLEVTLRDTITQIYLTTWMRGKISLELAFTSKEQCRKVVLASSLYVNFLVFLRLLKYISSVFPSWQKMDPSFQFVTEPENFLIVFYI